MKFSTKLLSAAVLMASSSIALAAETASTDIQINVTKSEYVNFTGTAVTAANATQAFSDVQVDGTTVSLGTLGAESNVPGGCALSFSSLNGYELLLAGSPSVSLHNGAVYTVQHNTAAYAADCNQTASDLSLIFPTIPTGNVVAAGVYSDTLTITVVTQ